MGRPENQQIIPMLDSDTKIKIANNRLITIERRYWTASAVSLLIVYIVSPHFELWQLAAISAILITASHVLSVITYLYHADPDRDSRPDYWENWLVAGNLVAATLWGTTTAWLYLALPPDETPFLILVVTLVMGAWSTANVPSLKCVYAFFLPAGIPIFAAVVSKGTSGDIVTGFVLLFFFLGILKHARHVSEAYRSSVEATNSLEEIARIEARNKEIISQAYARQSDLLDSIPVPLTVSRLSDGKMLYFNSATSALISPTPMQGNESVFSSRFFVNPEQRDLLVKEIAEKGGVHDFELHLKRHDDSTFWAFYSASIMLYQGETVIIGAFNDITARREAERAHSESEEKLRLASEQQNARLRDLLDSVPVPIVVSSQVDGAILYMNRAGLNLANIDSLSDMPGVTAVDFFADEAEGERLRTKISRDNFIFQEDYQNVEFQLKRPDGSSMWVFYSAEQMIYEGQQAIIGSFSDITVRRQAEEELRKSEQKFRLLADHANDLISIYSMEGVCQYASPSVQRILGYAQEEFVGKALSDFVHPEDMEGIIAANARNIREDAVHTPHLFRIRHKAGHWEWMEAVSSAERDPVTGAFTQFSSVSRNVTERVRHEQEIREARERAEAADRAKSDFLAHMSHEIRTPLNAVIGFSEIMRDQLFGPLGSEQYLEYSNDIYNSGTHLLALINEVLDLSKIEAGKFELQENRIPLENIIDSAFRFLRERADTKLIAMQRNLHVTPDLWCDKRVLTQVILNIVGNAIKFTPERGRVTVESSLSAEGDLILTVTDTGIGISEEDLPIVMKPFGQARGSTAVSAAEPGTGLGLPLSKSFIEKHDGTLVITSEPGIGTRVIISIPAARIVENQENLVSAAL